VRRNLIQRRTLIVSRQISKIFNSVELENLPYLDSLLAAMDGVESTLPKVTSSSRMTSAMF